MLKVQIRWLIRRDMPEVLEIEQASFRKFAWTEEHFLAQLRERDRCGMVAVDSTGFVQGYMLYLLQKDNLRVLNFAVNPKRLRRGIGKQLVQRLKDKIACQKREQITLEVREGNLPAQLFFKSQGFIAIDSIRDFYEDTDESAIQFRYRPDSVCRSMADAEEDILEQPE